MPDRPVTIAAYAAGASLAAVTLVYVFGPTFFLDETPQHARSGRKRNVVGLVNAANDCFINSVLQVLAGLPELRAYLIRELHRRKLDGPNLYDSVWKALEDDDQAQEQLKDGNAGSTSPEWKARGMQQGLVAIGLKEILDALNERPIYKKTISAQPFIRIIEQAFRTRISRSQQDAQEFLQVIMERLADEHHAAAKVRRKSRQLQLTTSTATSENQIQPISEPARTESSKGHEKSDGSTPQDSKILPSPDGNTADEETCFPLEGHLESEIQCTHCGFKPRPSVSSFLTLTLHVPNNEGSTSLNACLDGLLKVEHIDDFTCDRCRLEHAIQVNARRLSGATLSSKERTTLEEDRIKLTDALHQDPEKPPKDVLLPDISTAPKRRISRHTRISVFPQILAIHLSRSIWDLHAVSSKNLAKVSFPESLSLGGLLDRHNYRLLGVITHKGGHDSGHYESFRRQFLAPPYSTRASLGTEGIYSVRSNSSASFTPNLNSSSTSAVESADAVSETTVKTSEPSSTDAPSSPAPTPPTSSNSSHFSHYSPPSHDPLPLRQRPYASPPLEAIPTPGLPAPPGLNPPPIALPSALHRSLVPRPPGIVLRDSKQKSSHDRWWRISDDKIKECKTSEVLSMQREVYLLFFERIPLDDA